MSKLAILYETNLLDTSHKLRELADAIDAGDHGDVGTCAIALVGDTFKVFAFGPDSGAPHIGMMFLAAANEIADSLRRHGAPCDQ